jgi:hypothetical protein
MNAETFRKFTEIAYQFGPFFFALLFIFVVSRWAYKIYHAQHKSTDKEKETYRWIFISTTVFGMILVMLSVMWWWNYRPTVYIFRGKVKNLKEYERVISDNLFLKPVWSGKYENVPQKHTEEFAVIQETPFSPGQSFEMQFLKGPNDQNPNNFTITYESGNTSPQYEIVWDTSKNVNQLKSVASLDNGFRFQFFDRAYAQNLPAGKNDLSIQAANQDVSKYENIIAVLQDENTDVGSKIAALDKLITFDTKSMNKLITTKTKKEDMILTIADLSRHTDRELSFKAQKIAQSANLYKILSDRLNSINVATVKDAQQIVKRLDKAQAANVLKSVNTKQSNEMKRFADDILSGRLLTPLKPTGSSKGDRYYVRAQWNPNDNTIVDCLTRLFNQELLDRPTLKEETDFMKGRSERWVYWYSKEWALEIARKINNCGGKATFGSP